MARKANKLSSAEREAMEYRNTPNCGGIEEGYICTRALGHRGKHYAGGSNETLHASWDPDGSNFIEYRED